MDLIKHLKNLIKNINNDQIFSLIGIILGIPNIIVSLFLVINLNQEIKWTNDRITGVQYSKLLKDLLQDVQHHRGFVIGYLNEDQDLGERLKEKESDILQKLKNIKSFDAEITNSQQSEIIEDLIIRQNEINK